jgi:hypothetical protein
VPLEVRRELLVRLEKCSCEIANEKSLYGMQSSLNEEKLSESFSKLFIQLNLSSIQAPKDTQQPSSYIMT